jgi:hypothetical protein
MRSMLWVAGIALAVSASHPAVAYYCENGQMPAPPAIAAQMALPQCGFAATKRWGPNGCQLCDARNVYPSPYGYEAPYVEHRPRRHVYRTYR